MEQPGRSRSPHWALGPALLLVLLSAPLSVSVIPTRTAVAVAGPVAGDPLLGQILLGAGSILDGARPRLAERGPEPGDPAPLRVMDAPDGVRVRRVMQAAEPSPGPILLGLGLFLASARRFRRR